MFVQLKKRTVVSFPGVVRVKCQNILLGNSGYFFDRDFFTGQLCPHRGGEGGSISRIRLGVDSEHAMSTFGVGGRKREEGDNYTRECCFHGRLIKGLTGFATFAD